MKIKILVIRTLMCGRGTAYDVLVRQANKAYRPIASGIYATVIMRDGRAFYSLTDFLRTRESDALPYMSKQRWDAFVFIERVATRLAKCLATKAFPELRSVAKLSIWESWSLDSATEEVTLTLNERNATKLSLVGAKVKAGVSCS